MKQKLIAHVQQTLCAQFSILQTKKLRGFNLTFESYTQVMNYYNNAHIHSRHKLITIEHLHIRFYYYHTLLYTF